MVSFTHLDHAWLMKFLEHRIADTRMLRLIHKWLKAGVIEEGVWTACDEGTPQGATMTPPTQKVTSSSRQFAGGRLAEGKVSGTT